MNRSFQADQNLKSVLLLIVLFIIVALQNDNILLGQRLVGARETTILARKSITWILAIRSEWFKIFSYVDFSEI